MSKIIDKFKQIGDEISAVCQNKKPIILPVTKGRNIEQIKELIDYGHYYFAENKVQEAIEKYSQLKKNYPQIKLHFIGHLQTNKVKEVVSFFDYIHTIDRKNLAEKIANEFKKQNKELPCLIQINTGKETNKFGVIPEQVIDFTSYCMNELELPIKGYMCIPPASENPEPHFQMLKNFSQKHQLRVLSMGMTNDYELAVKMGSSFLRIGRKIFE